MTTHRTNRTRLAAARAIVAAIASITALALSACGSKATRPEAIERYSDELRQAVAANVTDELRRDQMLSVVDRLEALQVRFDQQTTNFIADYRKLNADYDSTRPAFDQLFSEYRAQRIEARNEALKLHFEMASVATAAEWKSIGKAEAELYEEVNAAPGAGSGGK